MLAFFVSDLHGNLANYSKLFERIKSVKPNLIFIGGDLGGNLSRFSKNSEPNFYDNFLIPEFQKLKKLMQSDYPDVFIIMGNDDPKNEETKLIEGEVKGLWKYSHLKKIQIGDYLICGYSYCPPSPFRLKDWEKYDVSRFVDPGCVSPEEGIRTVEIEENDAKFSTIKIDLEFFTIGEDRRKSIFLFHSPPYKTNLDRAALDNKVIDFVKVDVHVGSIAIKKFIEEKQPLLTLHGHIHESTKITGSWSDRIGDTYSFNAAHHGNELSLIQFDLNDLDCAKRLIL
ncbi:MAG: metallophosphoesterase [Melioribacteraceae bacterium]|nr:metallophosphoesterase [Melioribacteraceae bacterium]MCF8265009.1 metallophosphoesterase [Melioribacteraceae bacterium]MCF8432492.1 metallophosphoesterase [Melioribacteraceae bacterium]